MTVSIIDIPRYYPHKEKASDLKRDLLLDFFSLILSRTFRDSDMPGQRALIALKFIVVGGGHSGLFISRVARIGNPTYMCCEN